MAVGIWSPAAADWETYEKYPDLSRVPNNPAPGAVPWGFWRFCANYSRAMGDDPSACNETGGDGGNQAVIALSAHSTVESKVAEAWLGYSQLWLNDTNNPQWWSTGTVPTNWARDHSGTISVEARDGGLGMKAIYLDRPAEGRTDATHGCNGSVTSRCPESLPATLSYNTATWPEGKQTMTLSSKDILDHPGTEVAKELKIDRTAPPKPTATGTLHDNDGKAVGGTAYDLAITAQDQSHLSGAGDIKIWVDRPGDGLGEVLDTTDGQGNTWDPGAQNPQDGGSIPRSYRLNTTGEGMYRVTVKSYDRAGNETATPLTYAVRADHVNPVTTNVSHQGLPSGWFENATITTTVTGTDAGGGIKEGKLIFPGGWQNEDRVTTSYNPFAVGSARTFEGWAKRDNSGSWDMLFGGSGTYAPVLYLQQNQAAMHFHPDSTAGYVSWSNMPAVGTWFHWSLVFDDGANRAELFINGASRGSLTTTVPYNSNPGTFTIGYTTPDNEFSGSLDDVAVYSRALSAAEVGQLYQPNPFASRTAFWRLNETQGPVAYDSVGDNDGTYVATPQFGAAGATADGDKAVRLNADPQPGENEDRVTTSYNPFAVGSARTFEGWAKRDNSGSWDMLFGGSGTYAPVLYLQQNQAAMHFHPDSTAGYVSWSNMPAVGTWFHWSLVFDDGANRAELFINGASRGSLTTTVPYNSNPGTFTIGYTTPDNEFSGSLDDVAVYSRALSAAEVGQLYQPNPFAARTAFWRLNETSGPVAYDSAGDYDGTYGGVPQFGIAGATADGDKAVRLNANNPQPGVRTGPNSTDPNCAGTVASPCPNPGSASITYTQADLPEGVHTTNGKVVDAAGRESDNQIGWITKRDASPPNAPPSLAGTLAAANGWVSESTAHSLNTTWTDSHSGMKSSEVQLTQSPVADDRFGRFETGGWGKSDDWVDWTVLAGGTSSFSTDGSGGLVVMGAERLNHLPEPAATNVNARVQITYPATPPATGDLGGWISSRIQIDGQRVDVGLVRQPDGSLFIRGRLTSGFQLFNVPTGNASGNRSFNLRVQVDGTTVRASAWRVGVGEPPTWTVNASNLSIPTGQGLMGLRTDGGNTSLALGFDDFAVTRLPEYVSQGTSSRTCTADSPSTTDAPNGGCPPTLTHPHTWNTTGYGDGTYRFKLIGRDPLNHPREHVHPVRLDTVFPWPGHAGRLFDARDTWLTGDQSLALTGFDGLYTGHRSGVRTVEIKDTHNGVESTPRSVTDPCTTECPSTLSTSWTFNRQLLGDGYHTIKPVAIDRMGHRSDWFPFTVKNDKQLPRIPDRSGTLPAANGRAVRGSNFTLSTRATDGTTASPSSGVRQTKLFSGPISALGNLTERSASTAQNPGGDNAEQSWTADFAPSIGDESRTPRRIRVQAADQVGKTTATSPALSLSPRGHWRLDETGPGPQQVANSGFETNTDGWSNNSGAFWNPVTSVTRLAEGGHSGVAFARVATPGRNHWEGPSYQLSGPFRRGVRYTVSVWVRGVVGSGTVGPTLGATSSDNGGIGTAITSATGWTQVTSSWTPTAEAAVAYVAISTRAASQAMTFDFDDVQVYETGTNAKDGSQAYNPGTYTNSPTLGEAGATTDGNGAVRFNGSNWVSVPDAGSLDLGDNFTIEAWYKRTGTADAFILGKGGGAYALRTVSGRLSLRKVGVGSAVESSVIAPGDGLWHHVVATKAGPTAKLYLDGQDVTGTVTSQTFTDSSDPLHIGTNAGAAESDRWNGWLDDVAVYSRALTETEAMSLYNPEPADWRIADWRMNELAGATAEDSTTRPEQVTNGSFETDLTGWGNIGLASMTRSTSRAHVDAASLRAVSDGTADRTQWTTAPLVVGRRYTFSARVLVESMTTDQIFLRVADNTGSGPGIFTGGTGGQVTATGEWRRVSVSFVAQSATPHQLQVRQNAPGDATWYVDDVSLRERSSGTYNGGFTLNQPGATGDGDRAVDFNSAHVDLSFAHSPTSGFTIETWARLDSTLNVDPAIVSQRDGGGTGRSLLYVPSSTGRFASNLGGTIRDSGFTPQLNRYYHVVFTYAGGTSGAWNFYVDGARTAGGTATAESSTGGWVIGANKNRNAGYWDGPIDDVSVYGHALSAPDVARLAAGQTYDWNVVFDNGAPALAAPTHDPPLSEWVNGTTQLRADLTAEDLVSGVKRFELVTPGGPVQAGEDQNCSDSISSLCPTKPPSRPIGYTAANVPDGLATISATALDPAANRSAAEEWQRRVDSTAPAEPVLTGELWDSRDGAVADGTYELHVEAADGNPEGSPHAGIEFIRIYVQDPNTGAWTEQSPDDADVSTCGTDCPHTASRDWTFDTAGRPEGRRTIRVTAFDKAKNPRSTEFKVVFDKTPPEFTERSGTLWDQRNSQTALNGKYYLTVRAKDGDTTNPQLTARSGVEHIEVYVDDVLQDSVDQDCPGGNCTGAMVDWEFDTANYPGGSHTVKIVVRDRLDHELTDSFTVTTQCCRGTATTWATLLGARDVRFADVDGSMGVDAVTRDAAGNVSVGHSNGSGFDTPVAWGTWSTTYEMHLGDVNDDGRADLVGRTVPVSGAPELQSDLKVGLSTGTAFAAEATWGTWSSLYDMDVVDLNAEDGADVVGRDPATGDVRAALSDGIGTFEAATSWGNMSASHDLSFADADSDGSADAIGHHQTTGDVQVALAGGEGFKASTSWGTWSTDYELTFGDVDGNQSADAVGRNTETEEVRYGASTQEAFQASQAFGTWTSGYTVESADVDGDGLADVLGVGGVTPEARVALSNAPRPALPEPADYEPDPEIPVGDEDNGGIGAAQAQGSPATAKLTLAIQDQFRFLRRGRLHLDPGGEWEYGPASTQQGDEAEAKLENYYEQFAQAGVHAIRFLVEWGHHENRDLEPNTPGGQYPPGQGRYNFWHLYHSVRSAREAGLQVLLTLSGSKRDCDTDINPNGISCPASGSGPATSTSRNPDPAKFGEFVKAAVLQFTRGADPQSETADTDPTTPGDPYGQPTTSSPVLDEGDRVHFFSIWNEPNHKGWLQLGPDNTPPTSTAYDRTNKVPVVRYRQLYEQAKVAYDEAITGTDGAANVPGTKILIGELSSRKSTYRFEGESACGNDCDRLPVEFLEAVANGSSAGLQADGLAYHPYQPSDAPWDRPEKEYRGITRLGEVVRSLEGLCGKTGSGATASCGGKLRTASGTRPDLYLTEFGYLNRPEVYKEATSRWHSEGERELWLKSEGSTKRGVLERARKYAKWMLMYQVIENDPEDGGTPQQPRQSTGDNGIVGIRPPTSNQDDEPQDTNPARPWQLVGKRYYNKKSVARGSGVYGGRFHFWTENPAVRNRAPFVTSRRAYCAIRNWAVRRGDYGPEVTRCP
ncbi:MAG: carbohydrate binding domain-containing protein [Actinomycetota bacterium]|nr:carbohydrate binding domain-containing protein [Actinomycetota bacterium]